MLLDRSDRLGDGPQVARAATHRAPSTATDLLRDLIAIARPAQWTKHIFIVPGLLAGLALANERPEGVALGIALGFVSACLLASANYVLNEWLDAEFDRHHPMKGTRPAALGRLTARIVYLEYAALAGVGLLMAAYVSKTFFVTSLMFLAGAIVYNVSPLRTKERVHLDILSEALNNPLRLLLGWFMVAPAGFPPLSLLLLYWCGGAFLMATKRLAEYRYLVEHDGPSLPARYRKSFAGYDQTRLMLACFLYGILSSFSLAVLLIKYRAELILSVPLFAWLFTHYLYVALNDRSLAEAPEKFYRQRGLMPILFALIVVVAVLSIVDIPIIERLIQSRFTSIDFSR
jgi:decaprenyl-phosphate phosphoribosyltransferase